MHFIIVVFWPRKLHAMTVNASLYSLHVSPEGGHLDSANLFCLDLCSSLFLSFKKSLFVCVE